MVQEGLAGITCTTKTMSITSFFYVLYRHRSAFSPLSCRFSEAHPSGCCRAFRAVCAERQRFSSAQSSAGFSCGGRISSHPSCCALAGGSTGWLRGGCPPAEAILRIHEIIFVPPKNPLNDFLEVLTQNGLTAVQDFVHAR